MNIPRLWKTFYPSMLNIPKHLLRFSTPQIFLWREILRCNSHPGHPAGNSGCLTKHKLVR